MTREYNFRILICAKSQIKRISLPVSTLHPSPIIILNKFSLTFQPNVLTLSITNQKNIHVGLPARPFGPVDHQSSPIMACQCLALVPQSSSSSNFLPNVHQSPSSFCQISNYHPQSVVVKFPTKCSEPFSSSLPQWK